MPRPEAGDLRSSPTASPMAKPCTRPALPATRRPKITTLSSPNTHPKKTRQESLRLFASELRAASSRFAMDSSDSVRKKEFAMKIFATILALTGLLLAGVATAQPVKPTIVLVHGAFADSSSWYGVIAILEKDGYPVVAAANPLRSVKGDADTVRSLIATIKMPVVLVGHSYGGMVISN